MANYLENSDAIQKNILQYLGTNPEDVRSLSRLKIAKRSIVPVSFKELENQHHDLFCKDLNKLLALDTEVLKSQINNRLNSFKQEYQKQNFYYNATNPETAGVSNDVEKKYPFIAWLNYFNIDVPELWNESLYRTSIQLMLDIDNETPINQPINETRMDDLIKELGRANDTTSLDDLPAHELEELGDEDKAYIQTKFSEFGKKVLISVYMAIMSCDPTELNGGKNKRQRRRTKRHNQKSKQKSRKTRKTGKTRKT